MKLLDEVGQSNTPKVRCAWPIGFTPADIQRAQAGPRGPQDPVTISTGNVIGVVDDDPGEGTWHYRIGYPSQASPPVYGPWAAINVAQPGPTPPDGTFTAISVEGVSVTMAATSLRTGYQGPIIVGGTTLGYLLVLLETGRRNTGKVADVYLIFNDFDTSSILDSTHWRVAREDFRFSADDPWLRHDVYPGSSMEIVDNAGTAYNSSGVNENKDLSISSSTGGGTLPLVGAQLHGWTNFGVLVDGSRFNSTVTVSATLFVGPPIVT